MSLQDILSNHIKQAIASIYNAELLSVEFQATRKEFVGDITIVVFPMLRVIKGNPVVIGESIGSYLQEQVDEVIGFNVVKGFLNLEISDTYYTNFFNTIKGEAFFGFKKSKPNDKAVMVEYSSPNTNKPLHLGHVRNNLLGYSVAEILKAAGNPVYKHKLLMIAVFIFVRVC
jgi:arginyl-tRNA synthetase